MASHEPVRTCIATNSRAPQSTLLRVVIDREQSTASQTVVVADPARRLPGRGAWITPTEAAVSQSVKKRGFNRAFKVSTPVDASAVMNYVRDHETVADQG